MSDLQIGDSVVCDVGDNDIRVGTIVKTQPPDSPTQYYYVVRVIYNGDSFTTMPFYKNELIKTYNNHDLDNQINTMETL